MHVNLDYRSLCMCLYPSTVHAVQVMVVYLNNVERLCCDRVREVTSRRTNSTNNTDTAFSTGVTYAYHSASSLIEGCQASTQVSREPIFCRVDTRTLIRQCSLLYMEQYTCTHHTHFLKCCVHYHKPHPNNRLTQCIATSTYM